MVKALFDSNIVIDMLAGRLQALDEIAHYEDGAISVITWMEASCKLGAAGVAAFDTYLSNSQILVIHTDDGIMR